MSRALPARIALVCAAALLAAPFHADAAFEERAVSARTASLANAFCARADDVDSLYFNPAGLVHIRRLNASATYTQLYGLSDLKNVYMGVAGRLPWAGVLGVSFNQFGTSAYRETQLTVGFATALTNKFALGLNIKPLQRISMDQFGSANSVGIDIGAWGRPHEWVDIGFNAKNINNPTIGSVDEMVPQFFRFGFAVHPEKGLITSFDINKPIRSAGASVSVGQELQLANILSLRAGVSTNPTKYSFGFGVGYRDVWVDYAFASPPQLPPTHVFTISFRPGSVDVIKTERKKASAKAKKGAKPVKGKKQAEAAELQPVDPNIAAESELRLLPGVNKTLAGNVVSYRKDHPPFKQAEDLLAVPRMSRKILQQMREYLKFEMSDELPSILGKPAPKESPTGAPPDVSGEAPPPVSAEGAQPSGEDLPPGTDMEEGTPAAQPKAPGSASPSVEEIPVLEKLSVVDVNKVDEMELRSLGFTQTEASNILRFRKRRGRIESAAQLKKIPGIRKGYVDKVGSRIEFGK